MAEADTDKKNNFIREIDSAIRIFKTNPQEPKNKDDLFKKLFELMTFECGQIWADVLRSDKYTQKLMSKNLIISIESLLVQLQYIFYSKSKWIKKDGSKDFDNKKDIIEEMARIVKESFRIDPIPSKLFLEFLLFVARQIVILKNGGEIDKISCLGTLVRRSDQESVLNNAQEIDRFFLITTEPTTRGIFQQILQIYDAYDVRFTGNISISHIIGQLCEGITGSVTQSESSQSPDKPLEVRSEMEQIFINSPSLLKADVQKSLPVKGGITKTKPISSIRNPALSLASSRTNARPDATILKFMCKFGDKCNRKRLAKDGGDEYHFDKYIHPPNFIHIEDRPPPWRPGGGSGKSKRSRRRLSAKRRAKRRTTRRR
jgi:hypothetical protein